MVVAHLAATLEHDVEQLDDIFILFHDLGIDICRCAAPLIDSTVTSGFDSSASPPTTANSTMASAWPPSTPVICVAMSSEKTKSTFSRLGLPPHQSSLRANVAPVAMSYFSSLNGPVPLGRPSSVVPVS